MMMIELEAKLNASTDFLGVLSLGGVVLSGILLFTPVKAMGYIGIGSGLGAFSASIVTRKKHLKVATDELKTLVEHQKAEKDLHNELLLAKDGEIATLKADFSKGFKRIEQLTEQATLLQGQVDSLTVQNQSKEKIIEQVTNELDRLIALARTAVEESLDEWSTRINLLVVTRIENYPKMAERLDETHPGLGEKLSKHYPNLEERLKKLLDEGQKKLADYAEKLSQTPSKWDSLGDLLSIYYCLNDDLGNIKTKIIQAIAKLTNQETQLELKEVSEILEEWQTANLVPRDKLEHIIKNYEAALNEYRLDFSNRFNGVCQIATELEGQSQEDDKFVKGILAKMQELEGKIRHLSRPLKYHTAIRSDMLIANTIIDYFERLGVILDRAGTDYRSYEATLEFNADRSGRLILAKELNDHLDVLEKLTHWLNKPEFKLDAETGLLTIIVRWANPKEPVDAKLYDITKLGAKRGFLVTGHPGAGKTSTICWLGQQFGGIDSQKLALTPHEEDTENFNNAGFAVISDMSQIIQQISLLDGEITKRGKDTSRRFKLIVVIDELGRILDSSNKPEELMETVKHIAVEGRKLEVIVLVGNHSQTTSAIKMDGEFRSSFYQLFLVGAARYAINQPGRNIELKKWEKEWISEAAYPCLALINGQYKVCKHPTHHEYSVYKDSGNAPMNIERWEINPLTIELVHGSQHLATKEDRQYHFSLSQDEQKVIEYAQKKSDWVTLKGLSDTTYFRKERGLKLSEIKPILERLNELNVITFDSAAKPPRYRTAQNTDSEPTDCNG